MSFQRSLGALQAILIVIAKGAVINQREKSSSSIISGTANRSLMSDFMCKTHILKHIQTENVFVVNSENDTLYRLCSICSAKSREIIRFKLIPYYFHIFRRTHHKCTSNPNPPLRPNIISTHIKMEDEHTTSDPTSSEIITAKTVATSHSAIMRTVSKIATTVTEAFEDTTMPTAVDHEDEIVHQHGGQHPDDMHPDIHSAMERIKNLASPVTIQDVIQVH